VIKSVNTYYTTKEEVTSFIHDENIQNSSSLLIQIFSAINNKNFISTLLSELIQLLPDAVIIGSTTDGEIMDGKVSSGKVVLNFTQFEHTTLKAAAIAHQVDGYYSGQYLAKELIGEDTKLFIAFVDGLHTNGEEFLSGIDAVNDEVIIAGGHAGDNSEFKETLVFTKEHIFTQGAVGVTLNSKHLNVHEDYSFNWHPIGNEIESETLPLQIIAPVSGFFTYGEFFTSNKKELFNQTMTLLSLSESDSISKTTLEANFKEIDIHSPSMDALTHLLNITSKEAEEQREILKESNKLNQELKDRIEMALSGSKTSVLDWDFTNNSIYISPSWKKMLGYDDKELPNALSSWADRVYRDDQKKILSLLRKHQNDKIRYFESTHRLKHKDGHWVWVLGRAQIIYNENGKKVRMVGTHTDITEEKELQLKYFYQSQMIEQINDSITTTDLQGNIVSWNSGSEKTFGYSASEAIGKSISMLYREEDIPTLKGYIPALMEKGILNADLYLVKKSKELIPIAFSLTLLRDQSGKPIGIVGVNKDITKRKKAEDELSEQRSILYHQAHHDALTGLPNRVLFLDRLEQGVIKAKRHSEGLALFFIDLDKFKHINDSLGHDTGDSVLKIVSKRLENIVRKEDTVARLSGDEFTIIIEELKNPQDISTIAEKILKTLQEPIHIENHQLYVSGSLGISMYPEDATDAQNLLKYADTAMYKAKEEGRNNFQFYSSDMTEFAMKRIAMKTSLRQAIDEKEFIIYYQPQVNSCSDELVGMEALIRWKHPTMGLLTPDQFIPLSEETGMIIEVDRWVMRTSMIQISHWYKEGLNPGVLGLNLSVNQLESNDFIHLIKESIEAYDFKPEWLELEITEGQMMTKTEEVISKLRELDDLGVSISIDDFGTGYSSLSLLKRLPIHKLKIDQSFIQDIPADEEDIAIVHAIIALAESLNLDLVAEGVETFEQKEFLVNNGCINMQGYYFSRPVPAEEMRDILLEGSTDKPTLL